MNNSGNSASPTTQKVSPEVRQDKSSYWLTPEEIQALHEDSRQTIEKLRELKRKRREREQQVK